MDIVDIALKYFGIPYQWGGNKPEEGFDCSGFVLECMRSIGLYPEGNDISAQGIHDYLVKKNLMTPTSSRGRFLFFGRDIHSITHIAIGIDNRLMIEAGGEGRTSTNHGYVRIRPIMTRSDLVRVL